MCQGMEAWAQLHGVKASPKAGSLQLMLKTESESLRRLPCSEFRISVRGVNRTGGLFLAVGPTKPGRGH